MCEQNLILRNGSDWPFKCRVDVASQSGKIHSCHNKDNCASVYLCFSSLAQWTSVYGQTSMIEWIIQHRTCNTFISQFICFSGIALHFSSNEWTYTSVTVVGAALCKSECEEYVNINSEDPNILEND